MYVLYSNINLDDVEVCQEDNIYFKLFSSLHHNNIIFLYLLLLNIMAISLYLRDPWSH